MLFCTQLRSFFMSSLFLFVLACSDKQEVVPPVNTVTVGDARQYFQDYLPSAAGRTSKQLPERTPQWEQARVISLTNGIPAVAVPLQYKTKGMGKGGLTQLLFFREQGQPKMQVMKIVADSLYYYRNKERVNLENLSGVLTMHDWQENFLYGVKYTNGKVAGTLSLPSSAGRIGPTCELVTITHFVKVCVGSECSTSVDYVEQYIDCSGGGGGGGLPLPEGPLGGGGGGGTSPSQPSQPLTFANLRPRGIVMPGLERDPIDLARYLACFGLITDDAKYEITVYVDEPATGLGLNKFGLDVGHTFVGMKKQYPGADTYVQQVFGFYPNAPTSDILAGTVPSEFSSNGNSDYTISVTYTVSASQFQNAMNAAGGMIGQGYNLATQNCTDVVFAITNAAGLSVPQSGTMLPWGGGYGHSPGQLGYDLRNGPQAGVVNDKGGLAPLSLGPC